MNKVYSRINWENYPSDATPLNETNLNKLDYATDEIDDRVITLDTTKLDLSTANSMVKDISYDESTGIFTVAYLNGSTYTLDTKLEKLAVNFSYDASTEQLIITLDDGTVQYVDLSSLITEYEFLDSDIVLFTVDTDGKVSATIADGSITSEKLEPDYLAQITVQAESANASAISASTSAETATNKATAAANSASAASTSATNAATSASNASTSATNASTSAANAATSEANAEDYATLSESYAVGGTGTRTGEDTDNAKYYKEQASTSATSASASATNAATSEANASASATSASTSAINSATSADKAEDYAIGDTDSAKYYYEQSKLISEGFSGSLIPMGTVSFSELPDISDVTVGWMYNISDEFETTSEFKEGSGHTIPAGSNIYKTSDGYWDVLAGSPVTGVKGNTETTYRKGNVNLTPANIGALPTTTTYAASASVGGSATYSDTTADATNALYPVGVTSSANTSLKRNTSISMQGGTLSATTFSGNLSGNATTATKATQDANGNDIASTYLTYTGDTADNITTFTSNDPGDDGADGIWSVDKLESGETHSSIFNKVSRIFNNVRYMLRLIGTTDISSLGDGTVTGALNTISTNLDEKQDEITGGATTITSSDLTASRALISNSSGKVSVSAVTSTELGYLDGVTSNVQTQINKKQATLNYATTTTSLTSAGNTDVSINLTAPSGYSAGCCIVHGSLPSSTNSTLLEIRNVSAVGGLQGRTIGSTSQTYLVYASWIW